MAAESIIWSVPVLVAILGAVRPKLGLLALVVFLPLFGSPPGGPYLAALDVAAITAIIVCLRGERTHSQLDRPAQLFVLVGLLSLVPFSYLPPSWHPSSLWRLAQTFPGVESFTALYTWRAAANLLIGWGLFRAVRKTFDQQSIRQLGIAFLVSLTGVLLIGVTTQVGLFDLDSFRPRYGIHRPIERLQSVFFLSGWLAEYLVIVAPLATAALWTGGKWGRRATLPFVGLTLAALVFTQQRGAWLVGLIQAAACGAIWLRSILKRGLHPHQVWIGGGVLVAVTLGTIGVMSGINNPLMERVRSASYGLEGRAPLWSAALEMATERPAAGWGLGSFAPVYDLFRPPGTEGARHSHNTVHNLYLHLLAERGILGVLACGLLFASAVSSVRTPREDNFAFSFALVLSLVAILVYGLVQYLFYIKNVAWLIWIVFGAIAAIASTQEPKWTTTVSKVLGALAVLVTILRLVFLHPPALVGNQTFGFHEAETSSGRPLLWTEAHASQRILWQDEVLILSLANGHPRAGQTPVSVLVSINGVPARKLLIEGGWEEHRFIVDKPEERFVVVSFDVTPTFRPFRNYRQYHKLRRSTDIRLLGVATRPVRWESPRTAIAHGND